MPGLVCFCRLFRCLLLGLVVAIFPVVAGSAAAQGDLLVAPTRVVIANAGAGEVVLSNIGTAAATYRIGLDLRRMNDAGDIIDVAEDTGTDTERAALAMVHYAPRRITLQPGQPQAVRIAVRPPQDLPDGEYRVHMSFRAVPPVALEGDAQHPDTSAAASGVSIKLVPVFGITIPVIVRKGSLIAAGTLANPHVVRGERRAALALW
jgi:P pilus assembly chaperone PapD